MSKSHKIIMPALGMSQDTGHIIAWHKNIGDQVQNDDILLEVETDKTAMEVEAGYSGYIAQILAKEGTDVPVGQVIAVITAEKPDTDSLEQAAQLLEQSEAQNAAAVDEKEQPKEEAPAADFAVSSSIEPSSSSNISPTDKILASPKAKKFATEQSISLDEMRLTHISEPFHYQDVVNYHKENITAKAVMPASQYASPTSTPSLMRANIDKSVFDDFFEWVKEQNQDFGDASIILASFVSAAYRKSYGLNYDDEVIVAVEQITQNNARHIYVSPDRYGLSHIQPQNDIKAAQITLRNLTGSFLEHVQLAQDPAAIVTITLSPDRNEYLLTLSFTDQFDNMQAMKFMHDLAQTIALPARHML